MAKEQWPFSFPEDDPVYQFFLACDKLWQEKLAERRKAARRLETEFDSILSSEGAAVSSPCRFKVGERVQFRKETGLSYPGEVVETGPVFMTVRLDLVEGRPLYYRGGQNPVRVLTQWFEPEVVKAEKPDPEPSSITYSKGEDGHVIMHVKYDQPIGLDQQAEPEAPKPRKSRVKNASPPA